MSSLQLPTHEYACAFCGIIQTVVPSEKQGFVVWPVCNFYPPKNWTSSPISYILTSYKWYLF